MACLNNVMLFSQYRTWYPVSTMRIKRTPIAAAVIPEGFEYQPLNKSEAPQVMMINMPISGTYVYRSAMAWLPTCTIPITGTRVPTNQNQPVKTYGNRFKYFMENKDMPPSNKTAPDIFHAGGIPECG